MCLFWRPSRKSAVSFALSLLLFFSLSPCLSHAEVILTDEEAQALMSAIELSQKDLTELRTQLSEAERQLEESKRELNQVREKLEIAQSSLNLPLEELILLQKQLEEAQASLTSAREDYEKLKKSYEEQLSEAQRKNDALDTAVKVTGTSTACLAVVVALLLIL